MAEILITAGQLPPPACGYAGEQERLDAFASAMIGEAEDVAQWQSSVEEPSDLTKYWAKLDADGRQVAVLLYSVADARWVRWRGMAAYDGVAAGVPDAYTLTFANPFSTATAYQDLRRYVFEAPFTNAGPATLNVDGVGPINIRKRGDTDLAAGDIEVGQAVDILVVGVKAWLQTPVPPDPLPAMLQIQEVGAAMPGTASVTTVDITGALDFSVYLVCETADQGYLVDDELDPAYVQGASNNPAFAVSRTATQLTITRTADSNLRALHKSTATVEELTAASWTFVVKKYVMV